MASDWHERDAAARGVARSAVRSSQGGLGMEREEHAVKAVPGARTRIDPVCEMSVSEASPHRYVHHGTEVVFCSAACSPL
jgi:hypothetical protein